jgi:outer membrane protein assembly factor BamB
VREPPGREGTLFRLKLCAPILVAILAVPILAAGPASGSTPQGGTELWARRYHLPGDDRGTSVAPSPDGSKVFVTGYSQGGTGSHGSHDYATIAYDTSTGGTLWASRYNGPGDGDDSAFSVAASADGSKVFVTGNSQGRTGSADYATVAYDAGTGVALWTRRYNGPGDISDSAFSVAASPDGSTVFVTGQSPGATGSSDYATIAYDASTGVSMWTSRYDGPTNGGDVADFVAASPDGSMVLVTGYSLGTTGSYDYATIAYHASTGAPLWVRRYNGPGNGGDVADSVAPSPDGSKVVVTGYSLGATGASDYATIAYDASTGGTLWTRRYDGPGNGDDFASSVAATPDGSKVVVTGPSTGATGSSDYATIAYDTSTGGTLWTRRYDGPGNGDDTAFSVAASPDDSRVFVTGSSEGGTSGNDYATIAYDASTGASLWIRRYNGPGNGEDSASTIAASPVGSKVLVTGSSQGATSGNDYATIAYEG